MSHLSSSLKSESEKYRRAAQRVNWDAMIRQWAPVGGVVFLLFIFIYIKFLR